MVGMDDNDDIASAGDLLAALQRQDQQASDPQARGALRELLRAGVSVERAAGRLKLPVSTAWRMVTTDKDAQIAMNEGDDLRRRRLRSKLEQRADDMMDVIVRLANDVEVEDAVRLKAAQDILDRTGLLDKNTGKGQGTQTATVVELSSIDPDFHERLNRITVTSASKG